MKRAPETGVPAKCVNGWAKVGVAAGDGGGKFQRQMDVIEPYCQNNDRLFDDDLLQYNGLKRCFSGVPSSVPADQDADVSKRLLGGV
jgi:hypothetical protein